MALKATIFKAEMQISNMDEQHYATYNLTLARHPSETEQRMMLRLVAFALNADEMLSFTKGISTDEEPDLWLMSLSNEIDLWVELGQPDEKRVRKACGRAKRVVVYPYAERSAAVWWQQMASVFSRFTNLEVIKLSSIDNADLAQFAERNMHLHVTIQEGQVWLGDDQQTILLELQRLQ